MSKWDVYRDENGEPVTITWEQCRAIWHAVEVWRDVVHTEQGRWPEMDHTMMKSCLLGRMLIEGRPPLDEAPPLVHSAPAYWLCDPDLCPTCGELRTDPPGRLGYSVEPGVIGAQREHLTHDLNPAPKIHAEYVCAEEWHARG